VEHIFAAVAVPILPLLAFYLIAQKQLIRASLAGSRPDAHICPEASPQEGRPYDPCDGPRVPFRTRPSASRAEGPTLESHGEQYPLPP
jgi:hypothetical protein